MSLGLDPETSADDLALVEARYDIEGRMMGAQPAKKLVDERQRVARWLEQEQATRHGSPP